jgi:hypothetical protein
MLTQINLRGSHLRRSSTICPQAADTRYRNVRLTTPERALSTPVVE